MLIVGTVTIIWDASRVCQKFIAIIGGGGLTNMDSVKIKSALREILTGHDTRPNKTGRVSHSERSTKVTFDLTLCSENKHSWLLIIWNIM